MDFYVWQGTVLDDTGNVQPGTNIEVRDADSNNLVQLYDDVDGASPADNPIQTDNEGFATFYVGAGRYTITASKGAYLRTWENVRFGALGDELHYVRTAAEISAGVTPVNYHTPSHLACGYAIPDRYATNAAPGTTAMDAALAAAQSVALLAGVDMQLAARDYRLSNNCTITAAVHVAPGARFTVDASKTLTVNAPIYAGAQHVFTGSGTVSGTFGGCRRWWDWFGAVADMDVSTGAGTDNGPAIQRCLDSIPLENNPATGDYRRGVVYGHGGVWKIATTVTVVAGTHVEGDGMYATFLNCHTNFNSDVVAMEGGGPFSSLKNIAVACLAAGAPGRGVVLDNTANGKMLSNIYVAGFNTSSGGLVLDGTDIALGGVWLVENNTVNVRAKGAYMKIGAGMIYGGAIGFVLDNSAMTQLGGSVIDGVIAAFQSESGFVTAANSHDATFVNCAAGYDDNSKFSVAGMTLEGSRIKVVGFSGYLGTQSATANGISVEGSASNITLNGCDCRGFNIGLAISTSGANVQVNGGHYSLNRQHGVDFQNWTGPLLHLNGVQANTNGTGAAGDYGFVGNLHTADQRLLMNGCIGLQASGAGLQNYGAIIDCDQSSAKGSVVGCLFSFNTTDNYAVTGAEAAQVTGTPVE